MPILPFPRHNGSPSLTIPPRHTRTRPRGILKKILSANFLVITGRTHFHVVQSFQMLGVLVTDLTPVLVVFAHLMPLQCIFQHDLDSPEEPEKAHGNPQTAMQHTYRSGIRLYCCHGY